MREKGGRKGARKSTRKTLILVSLSFRYSLVAFQMKLFLSELWPNLSVFQTFFFWWGGGEVSIIGVPRARKTQKTISFASNPCENL